jgi:hypothetical protein
VVRAKELLFHESRAKNGYSSKTLTRRDRRYPQFSHCNRHSQVMLGLVASPISPSSRPHCDYCSCCICWGRLPWVLEPSRIIRPLSSSRLLNRDVISAAMPSNCFRGFELGAPDISGRGLSSTQVRYHCCYQIQIYQLQQVL